MDATRMQFRDNSFDIVIDKGTYDALACNEQDKTLVKNLTIEMLRVTRSGGALVIISNGIPEKRIKDFENFSKDFKVKIICEKIHLSKLS